jgi:hypothetical protein
MDAAFRPGSRVRVVPASLHPDYLPGDTGTLLHVYQPPGAPPMVVCAMDRTGQAAAFYPEEVEPLPPG